MVQTDGEENSSVRYSKERIIAMIEEQQNVYNWSFVFLGAGKEPSLSVAKFDRVPARDIVRTPPVEL